VVSVSKGGKSYAGTVPQSETPEDEVKITWRRVVYTMKDKKLSKKVL
jgi:hypothetical protein